MSMGHPSINLREDEEVDNALSVLLQQGYPRVCTLSGGFFALHEYIRRVNQTEWLIDHTPDACAVCKHYLFSDTLQKAVEASSEMASKTGMAEIGGYWVAAKAKEGFAKAKEGLQKTWAEQKAKSKKPNSFFSKALKWTKNLAADIQSEMEKPAEEVKEEKPEEVKEVKPEKELKEEEKDKKEEVKKEVKEEKKEEPTLEMPKEKPSRKPAEKKGDLVNRKALSAANTKAYSVDEIKTSSGLDGGKEYQIVCGENKLFITKAIGASKCSIVDSCTIESLSKMTKKKDDPRVVTLTFDNGDNHLIVWRVCLPESLQLCNDVTEMLSKLD